jgi:hypothetical protein
MGNEPRSGRPASLRTGANVCHVKAFICQDRRLTVSPLNSYTNCKPERIVWNYGLKNPTIKKFVQMKFGQKCLKSSELNQIYKRVTPGEKTWFF